MLRHVSVTLLVTSRWFADLSLGVLLIGALVTLAVVDERRQVAENIRALPETGRAIAFVPVPETLMVARTKKAHPLQELPDPGRLEDFANWPAGEPLDVAQYQPAGNHHEFVDVSAAVEQPLSKPRGNAGKVVSLKTYRTLCVRTCDGFFWQMSFAVPRSAFGVDSNACHASCSGETKLYALENVAGSSQTPTELAMLDADGEPYSKLPNADRFRKEFMPSCGCGAQPWEPAALARHATFARLAQAGTLAETLAAGDKARRANLKRVPVQVIALNASGGGTKLRSAGLKKRVKRKSLFTTKIVVAGNSLIQVLGLNASWPENAPYPKPAASTKIVRSKDVGGSIIQKLNAKR